jgi:hypothetical protein
LAYHDSSDGGLFATGSRNGLCRPCVGVSLNIDKLVEGDASDSRIEMCDSKNWRRRSAVAATS